MDNPYSESSGRISAVWDDFVRTLKDSKLVIALTFLFAVLGAYSLVQLRTELYQTEARVLVKLGRENTEAPITAARGGVISSGVRKEEINSEVELLGSRALIEETLEIIGIEPFFLKEPKPEASLPRIKWEIKRAARWVKGQFAEMLIGLNLKKRLSKREQVIVGIESALDVQRAKESDVLAVELKLPAPELAVTYLNTLLDLYRAKHIQVRRGESQTGFFDAQAQEFRERLQGLDDEESQLRASMELSDPDVERKILLERVHSLYSEIKKDEGEAALILANAKDPIRSLRPTDLEASNPSMRLMKERITTLRMRRLELYDSYETESRTIGKLDSVINNLESVMFQVLGRRLVEKKKQAAELETRIRNVDNGNVELEALRREKLIAQANFMNYSERLEDSRIHDKLDMKRVANIAILSPPTMPIEPIAPRKLLITGLSIPLGLVLGIALAVLLDYMSDRIRSPRDLADIPGLPFMGGFELERS